MPKKIGVNITEEMDKALRRQSKKTGIPVSEFVRRAIARELRKAGEKVPWDIEWGGYRETSGQPDQDIPEGQTAGMVRIGL